MRRTLAVLALVCASAIGGSEASARTISVELGGCRLLAGAYKPGWDGETLANMKAMAVARLRQSQKPAVERLASRDLLATPMYARDLGAWCKAHFPNDRYIRRARYPQGAESLARRTLPTPGDAGAAGTLPTFDSRQYDLVAPFTAAASLDQIQHFTDGLDPIKLRERFGYAVDYPNNRLLVSWCTANDARTFAASMTQRLLATGLFTGVQRNRDAVNRQTCD